MQIAIQLGKPDRDGKQTVVAKHSGIEEVKHVDHINTLDAYRRKVFAEFFGAKVLANSPYCSGGSYEQQIADIVLAVDAEIVRKAEEAAEQGEADTSWSPIVTRLDTVEPQTVTWLWPNRLAIGKLNDISGNAGLGKTLLALDITARGSTGSGWPDAPYDTFEPWGTVWMSAEDDLQDTLVPRLIAAGADRSRVAVFEALKMTGDDGEDISRSIDLGRDLSRLEAAIDSVENCRLLVIDPVDAYLGGVDAHKNAEVRGLLAPLAALAARRRFAVLTMSHLNKGQGQAIHRRQGSVAFIAAARSAWLVTRDKADPKSYRRLFLPVKANLAKDTDGLGFVLSSQHSPNGQPLIEWEAEPISMSADDALAIEPQKKGPEAEEMPEAVEFLRKALADGPKPTKDIEADAKGNGISLRTLKRARKELGVVASRPAVPGPWFLELPQGGQVLGPVALPHGTLGPLGPLGTVASSSGNNGQLDMTGGIGDQEGQVDEYLEQVGADDEYGHLPAQEF